jgi:hypothetical protein
VVLGYRYENGPVQRQVFHIRLTADQRDTLTFSPANLPGPGHSGIVRLKVFTINAQDQDPTNDTLNLLTVIPPAQPIIGTTLVSFQDVLGAGFYQSRSVDENPATGVFQPSTSFGPAEPTATFTMTAAMPQGEQGWLISPTYSYNQVPQISFKAAVTAGTLDTEPETQIAQDSLQVLFRIRCGPWRLAGSLSQSDTALGMLSNELSQFVLPTRQLGPDTIQFAFRVVRGGAPAPRTYRWHVNRIAFADIPVGTKPALLSSMKLYPNPAQGKITVSFGKKVAAAQLSILDLSGRSLLTATASGMEATLDVHHLASGIYRLKVRTPEGTLSRPFTVK